MPTQNFEIRFGGGMNQDLEEKVLEPPYLQKMVNAEFDKAGAVNRRGGHSAITHQDILGNTLGVPVRLGKHKDAPLLFTKDSVYQYIAAAGKWSQGPLTGTCLVSRQSISRNETQSLSECDSASTGGYVIHIWRGSGGISGIFYNIYDATTGAPLQYGDTVNQIGSSSSSQAHVVAVGSVFFVVYVHNNAGTFEVRATKVDPTNLAGGVSTTTLATDVHTTIPLLDAAPFTSTSFLIAYYTTGNQIKVATVSNTPAVTASNTINETLDECLTVMGTTAENVYVAWARTGAPGGVVKYAYLPTNLSSNTVTTVSTHAEVKQVGLVRATSSSAHLVWQKSPMGSRHTTYRRSVSNTATLGTQYALFPFSLQSKPWTYDGDFYVCLGYESTIQGTAYVAKFGNNDVGGLRIVATLYPRECGDLRPQSHLPATYSPATGTVNVSATVKTRLLTGVSAYLIGTTGIDVFSFNFGGEFSKDRRFTQIEGADEVWIAGGQPSHYDGLGTIEAGFLYSPETSEIVAGSLGGGGSLAAGTYQAVFIYELQDAQGNVQRSLASIAKSSPAVNLNDRITWTVPHLSHIGRDGLKVVCRYYRTLVNTSGPFYRAGSNTCDTTTGIPTTPMTFTDGQADATISVNETVYTDGGVLDNVSPPSASAVAIAGDRVFLLCGRDVWYSKVFVQGELPGFSETMALRIEDGGDGTAIAALDDKIVVFKESRIFVLDGYGFGDKGDGQNFVARPIATDVGCSDSRSVVVGPEGIYFQGAAGIYLLTRGLQVQFFSSPVIDMLTSYPIVTSAVLTPAKQQVRWTITNGTYGVALVYDYNRKQWATWTLGVGGTDEEGEKVLSAAELDGVYYYAVAAGTRKSGSALWQDAGSTYFMKIRIAWVKLASLQGYQQIRRATLLGKKVNGAAISEQFHLGFFKDYDGSAESEAYDYATPSVALVGTKLQASIHIRKQKCEAFCFEFFEYTGDVQPTTAGYSLSSLLLEVEIKRGSARHLLGAGART